MAEHSGDCTCEHRGEIIGRALAEVDSALERLREAIRNWKSYNDEMVPEELFVVTDACDTIRRAVRDAVKEAAELPRPAMP
jgi:hypothetical protein